LSHYKHLAQYDNSDNITPGSSTDEFSPFRQHLISIRSRCKRLGRSNALCLQDLKDQWNQQQGICPYTGWKMENPISTSGKDKLPKTVRRASVDLIDSSKGYTKGNIQFVCYIAQYAKHSFTKSELLAFCQAVSEKFPTNWTTD